MTFSILLLVVVLNSVGTNTLFYIYFKHVKKQHVHFSSSLTQKLSNGFFHATY